MAAQLPAPRVVIASNTDDGKSVVSSDTTIPLLSPFGPAGAAFSTLWLTSAVPASTTEDLLSKQAEPSIPRPPEKGTVFGTSDMPPGATRSHQRLSSDEDIGLHGRLEGRNRAEIESRGGSDDQGGRNDGSEGNNPFLDQSDRSVVSHVVCHA